MDGYLSAPSDEEAALRDYAMGIFEQVHLDAALDDALRCTFPASDPVALNFAFTSLVSARTELIRRAFPRRSS